LKPSQATVINKAISEDRFEKKLNHFITEGKERVE
jgi:hypothetical protein